MADVFGDNPINDDVSFDTLVGEGKKYSNENDLAKAYANADNHIQELRRDLAQSKAKQDADKNLRNDDPPQQRQDDPPHVEPEKPQSKDDLRATIAEEIKNLSESQKFEQNVETTAQKLIDHFGDGSKANQAVKDKARELEVSPDWLRDLAARSPKAFYNTMGVPEVVERKDTGTPAPRSDMRTQFTGNSNVKNYAYFENLRKTDKPTYFSSNVQQEMQKSLKEQGDSFFA